MTRARSAVLLTLVCAVGLPPCAVHGQEASGSTRPRRAINSGVIFGAATPAHMRIDGDRQSLRTSLIGVHTSLELFRWLTVEIEALRHEKRRDARFDTGESQHVRLNELEVPLLVRAAPFAVQGLRPYFIAGAEDNWVLSCSSNYAAAGLPGDIFDPPPVSPASPLCVPYRGRDVRGIWGYGVLVESGRLTLAAQWRRTHGMHIYGSPVDVMREPVRAFMVRVEWRVAAPVSAGPLGPF